MLRDNPYAEWYRNSMQLPGSPTQRHHRETYGADYALRRLRDPFDDGERDGDLDALAGICARTPAPGTSC